MKPPVGSLKLAVLMGSIICSASVPVDAQTAVPVFPPPEEVSPEEPPELLPEESPEFDLAPAEPPPSFPEPPEDAQGIRFLVGKIELLGSSFDLTEVYEFCIRTDGRDECDATDDTIGKRIAELEGEEVTLEQLFDLRAFITKAYISEGYITSGAFLPEQNFESGGTVQIQLVEGELEAADVQGLVQLHESYISDRVKLRLSAPLNQSDIREALLVLQLDPIIDRVDAQLVAGSGPGQSILLLTIDEAPPLSAGLRFNNYRSPSTGSEQLNPYLSYTNLVGRGDRLDASYSFSEGLDSYSIDYTVPFTAQDSTFNVGFTKGDSRIVEDNFSLLDIRSDSETWSFGVRHPLVLTSSSELALGLSFDLRRSQTFLLDDIPFSFSVGPEDGESKVSVVRFSQDWVDRAPNRVLAARSQFSIGLDAFDATVNDTGTDGRFFSWLGQFQWVQQIPDESILPDNSIVVSRIAAQLTPDSLLSLEQFSLGGIGSVRGYRENELVKDNGVNASVELRLPLLDNFGQLQLTPFIEGGIGWNNKRDTVVQGLASVGLGLQWVYEDLRVRLDYGYPLTDIQQDGDSLQDEGFYFSVELLFDD